MKKFISMLLLVATIAASGVTTFATASAPTVGFEETSMSTEQKNGSTVSRNYSFEALKAEILRSRSSDNVEVHNLGFKEYSNGQKNQRILIITKASQNTMRGSDEYMTASATAVDHWFRGPIVKGDPIADVSVTGHFKYNGKEASVTGSSYDYDILDNSGQVKFRKKSLNSKDGLTAKVDLSYTIYYNVLWDNEIVTVKCDKNGGVTVAAQDELI